MTVDVAGKIPTKNIWGAKQEGSCMMPEILEGSCMMPELHQVTSVPGQEKSWQKRRPNQDFNEGFF